MSRLFDDLLLRAGEHLVTTGRRAISAIGGLFLIHVLLVTPWVERERERAFASSEEERLAAADDVAELRTAFDASLEEMGAVLQPALAALVENLEDDLERLQATVETLEAESSGGPLDGVASEAGVDGEPARDAILEIDDPEALAALRDAIADGSRYGLLAALEPIVADRIVEPRFTELRRTWSDAARPAVEPALDEAARAVPGLRRLLPETAEAWSALEGALTGFRTTLRDLELQPPAEPYWWAAPETSATSSGGPELGLTPALAERLEKPLAADELMMAGEKVRDRFLELGDELEAVRRQALAAAGASGGSELGDLLAGLGIDPGAAVEHFPLLLGIFLAAVIFRRSQRLRELAAAARPALEERRPDTPACDRLRSWCLLQLAGGGDPGDAASRSSWRALGASILALLWIAAAALQVRALAGLDERRWLAVSLAGAAAVVVAALHRLVVVRRVVATLSGAAPEPTGNHAFRGPLTVEEPPAVEEPPTGGGAGPGVPPQRRRSFLDDTAGSEDDPAVLDGHTLRR